jgi:endonuclease/exonuclease/phosphatase family metal-dependent hydrolase
MAQEIAAHHPEVVGLQEVFTFTLNGATGDPPYRDHLVDTLTALAALGESYQVAASVQDMQLAIPVDFDGDGQPEARVEVTERDVLLVRQDIPFQTVPFAQVCARPAPDGKGGCNYQVVLEHPATHIKIERGFAGADITVGARRYRVVTTHLEEREPDPTNPLSAAIQAAQATELLGLLHAPPPELPVIVLGDMNSSPDDQPVAQLLPPYRQFLAAGLLDLWSLRPGNAPGWTCCQAADLRNPHSDLSDRIDFIFTDFLPRKVKAQLVGNRVADKTRPHRLWPSDHAGVVAALTVD